MLYWDWLLIVINTIDLSSKVIFLQFYNLLIIKSPINSVVFNWTFPENTKKINWVPTYTNYWLLDADIWRDTFLLYASRKNQHFWSFNEQFAFFLWHVLKQKLLLLYFHLIKTLAKLINAILHEQQEYCICSWIILKWYKYAVFQTEYY